METHHIIFKHVYVFGQYHDKYKCDIFSKDDKKVFFNKLINGEISLKEDYNITFIENRTTMQLVSGSERTEFKKYLGL